MACFSLIGSIRVSEAKAYLEISERALSASEGALSRGIHEKATFLGYHAFESLGGALCTSKGVGCPRGHESKINKFVAETKHEKFAVQVAQLAVAFGYLRNAVLYPEVTSGGTVIKPKSVLSDAQARRLIGRTAALRKKIEPLV
jgi:hypothetical protein